jgi:arylformamidase
MKFVDLTHFVENSMPVFPGSDPVSLDQSASIVPDGYNEINLHITTHTGTHIDCTSHLIPDGFNTGTVSPEKFYGNGMVMDCREFGASDRISLKFMKRYEERLKTVDFVILQTGWDRYWGSKDYFDNFPVPEQEAALFLAGLSLKGIGIDAASFDPVESLDLAVHKLFMSHNLVLIENLTNLASLPEEDFVFCCFPLKIKNGDGSPVRAIGIVKA